MTDKVFTSEQISNADRMAAAITAVPPDTQSILVALVDAMTLGAQIAEQCRDNLGQQQNAS